MFQFATLLQPKINLFHFSLILLNCHQQMRIYRPYDLVDNHVLDWRHTTASLCQTDTSLRRTVEAGHEGVRLREV